jgi:monofunctional biosynthetic peptidoglycan transglycosylase
LRAVPARRSSPRRSAPRRPILRRVALAAVAAALLAVAAIAALWFTLPDPAALAKENPRTTALIEQRRAEARQKRRAFRPRQTWVALDRISPRLVHAVLLSEDANFFGHDGIDWEAMRDAAEHDLRVGRFARGASTLTQQLAKNLWLGTEKSLWRKLKEALLAAKLEQAASKKRILALYLNVVEMDEGVFGAEAGARHRFGRSAAELSPAQAVVLASLLPAPRRVDLARPSRWLKARSRRLLDRMREVGRLSAEEHLGASAELERILAGPSPIDDREEPPEDEVAAGSATAPPHPSPLPRLPSSTPTAAPSSTPTATLTAVPGDAALPPSPPRSGAEGGAEAEVPSTAAEP